MQEFDKLALLDIDKINQYEYVDYVDGDIALFDDLRNLPTTDFLQLNSYILAICTAGKLQLDINGKPSLLNEFDVVFCNPSTILNNYMLSPDFEGKIYILSQRIVQSVLHTGSDIWKKVFYIQQNPILHFNEDEVLLFRHYYELLCIKMKHPQRQYHQETMQGLVHTILYDLCACLNTHLSDEQNPYQITQGDIIFKKFIELLSLHSTKERSVIFYADELCVTPKYLSAVCKKASNKTASEWIQESVVMNIRYQLKNSDRSIKEIAYDLEFYNISFFGRYVKKHLGASPKEFRKQEQVPQPRTQPETE